MSPDRKLALQERNGSVQLPVLVQPRASRQRLVGVHEGALKVALTAPPLQDRANRQLIAFLARKTGLARSRLRLVNGRRSRRKTVEFQALTASQLRKSLALHLV